MNKIEKNIKLLKEITPTKDEFINEELRPSVKTSFNCCNCSANNEIEITPYQTGFPFFQVYKNNFLSVKSILNNKIASCSSSWASHFGEYLVYDLPTLYFMKKCDTCNEKFLIVFGYGESQPSKWVCKISSIWQIEEID
ncbi:hypothetical protein [Aquimarina sp. I32.4]|uniref:hypothetical protein n=1 Tax=Aquimarina sp. I32.4 TaxID=2053903 RepID=UPI000CDE7499|nr:hypothetical protein [Aquimarina sp. I32.4]